MKTLSLVVFAALLVAAQDPAKGHTSANAKKCRRRWPAYERALAYVDKKLSSMWFPAKMVAGWLFLADGRRPNEPNQVINTAQNWEGMRGSSRHAQNWYPALAGMLLNEYHKFHPTQETFNAIQEIVNHFVRVQERTGGWFKWYEGAYKDRLDYAVKDLGMLDAIVMGILWSAKTHGVKVPQDTLDKGEKCLLAILSASGISFDEGAARIRFTPERPQRQRRQAGGHSCKAPRGQRIPPAAN